MTNYEKLIEALKAEHKPFIVYDVETTGVMNGNDNRITQIAMAAYAYNNEQYELQDKIFMLAKPDKDVLSDLLSREKLNNANIERTARELFTGTITQAFADEARSLQGKIKRLMAKLDKTENPDKRKAIGDEADLLEHQLEELAKAQAEAEKTLAEHPECIFDVSRFKSVNFDGKVTGDDFRKAAIEKIKEMPRLKDVLDLQGIDMHNYLDSGLGLTAPEMQVGITEFLNKYKTNDTVFINNGTYFAKHYLDKAKLLITKESDTVIDLTQAQRSMVGGASSWTADIPTFAANYQQITGKEIKIFDALTKALCLAEISTGATDNKLSHKSLTYLENAVKEDVFKRDDEYVMSRTRAEALSWFTSPVAIEADFTFHELKYVDFGDDRRYVDLDKMFEVNDNFEITLEGHKEPIKTWEELEAKIKALNANISPELLSDIKEKYEEISKQAEQQKQEAVQEAAVPQEVHVEVNESLRKMEALRTSVGEQLDMLDWLTRKVDSMSKTRQSLIDEHRTVFCAFFKEQVAPLCTKADTVLRGLTHIYFKFDDKDFDITSSAVKANDVAVGNYPDVIVYINNHQEEFFEAFCSAVTKKVETRLKAMEEQRDKYERDIIEYEFDER